MDSLVELQVGDVQPTIGGRSGAVALESLATPTKGGVGRWLTLPQ